MQPVSGGGDRQQHQADGMPKDRPPQSTQSAARHCPTIAEQKRRDEQQQEGGGIEIHLQRKGRQGGQNAGSDLQERQRHTDCAGQQRRDAGQSDEDQTGCDSVHPLIVPGGAPGLLYKWTAMEDRGRYVPPIRCRSGCLRIVSGGVNNVYDGAR